MKEGVDEDSNVCLLVSSSPLFGSDTSQKSEFTHVCILLNPHPSLPFPVHTLTTDHTPFPNFVFFPTFGAPILLLFDHFHNPNPSMYININIQIIFLKLGSIGGRNKEDPRKFDK